MANIGEKIRTARISRGWSQERLAQYMGCSRSAVAMYESNNREPDLDTIELLADVFNTTVSYFTNDVRQTNNQIPIIGTIACGSPILAEENIEDYIQIPSYIHADFALRCKGDSMINARINDGDIVCIRKQETVENGQIAAVLLDNEATLKRIHYLPGGLVQLLPENPKYQPIYIDSKDETCNITIIGLATHFVSQVV